MENQIVEPAQASHQNAGASQPGLIHPTAMSREEWKKKYRPRRFQARGEAAAVAVTAAVDKDRRLVWTELDTGERIVIVNGWHFVNRVAYWISEVPCEDGLELEVS